MGPRITQRLAEDDFATPIRGQILDEDGAGARAISPSIWALRPKPFAFFRTYCIGSIRRSEIQAAKGKSWLRKIGQWHKWIFCLRAARILAGNQELR